MLPNYGGALELPINISMRVAEITQSKQAQAPLSPEQARVRAMRQGIARQKAQLAAEKERQHDAKQAEKMSKLRAQASM